MNPSIVVTFDGTGIQALAFYDYVFDVDPSVFVLQNEVPSGSCYPTGEEERPRLLRGDLPLGGLTLRFQDTETPGEKGGPHPWIHMAFEEEEELLLRFSRLAEEGQVIAPFDRSLWSFLEGTVEDVHGLRWTLSLERE